MPGDTLAIDYPRTYFGWSASSPADYANPTKGLVIHYNGPATNLKSHADCVAYWKGVRTQHVGSNGWADIGYSFGISVEGGIFEGRGLNRYQAAQGTSHGNANYYSVSLMIGGNERPTQAQIEAVRRLRSWLMSRGVSGTVLGHRDFVATSCPGSILYGMVRDGTFTGSPSGGYEPLLRRGDSGPAVREWQEDLLSVGVPLPRYGADGAFGAETEQATKSFQSWRGIDVDGIVGPQTRGEMRNAQEAGDRYPGGGTTSATPKTAKPASTTTRLVEDGQLGPLTAKATQRALGVTADGVWGPVTVRAMQRRVGEAADGLLGPKTTRGVQRRVGATVDGIWPSIRSVSSSGLVTFNTAAVSETTRRLQKALNEGTF